MIKRNHEPKDEFVLSDNTQSVFVEDVVQETEQIEADTESASTESSEAEEVIAEGETRTLYTTSSVFIRSGPSVNDSRIASLAVNDEVLAVGPAQDGWQKIMYDNIEAYVSTDFLSETPIGDASEEPQAESAPEAPTP